MNELLERMNALVAGAEGRSFTEDEATQYEALEAELREAQRVEQRDAELRSRHANYRTPVAPAVNIGARADRDEDAELRASWDRYLRSGQVDTELAQYRAQAEATGAAGGFLVPDGFRNKLVERMKAFGGIASIAETISTDSGQTLPWPTIDDTANSGEIVAEGGTFASGADLVFGTRNLQAYKFMAGGASNLPLKISVELLQDSAVDIAGLVSRKLGERLARVQATKWAVGTGVNEPQGLLSSTNGLTAATAISSNSAPTYANLLAIVHDLDPAYRGDGCRWVFNDAFLEKVRGIVDLDGRPLLWNSNASLGGDPGGMTLLGFPVTIDQGCPDPSASNRFGAFGQIAEAYVVRRVKGITLVTLNELYAANGQVGYMAWERADGCIQNANAAVAMVAAA